MKILRTLTNNHGEVVAVDVRLEVGEEFKGPRYDEGYEDGYRAGFEKGRNTAYQTEEVKA